MGQLVFRELRSLSLDEGILVIEWTAYDVVSLQHHFGLDFTRRGEVIWAQI